MSGPIAGPMIFRTTHWTTHSPLIIKKEFKNGPMVRKNIYKFLYKKKDIILMCIISYVIICFSLDHGPFSDRCKYIKQQSRSDSRSNEDDLGPRTAYYQLTNFLKFVYHSFSLLSSISARIRFIQLLLRIAVASASSLCSSNICSNLSFLDIFSLMVSPSLSVLSHKTAYVHLKTS